MNQIVIYDIKNTSTYINMEKRCFGSSPVFLSHNEANKHQQGTLNV